MTREQQEEKKEIMIQAKLRGPGPAYMLAPLTGQPGHDRTKRMAPAFSFGARRSQDRSDGPGPAHLVEGNMTHRGREDAPSFSLSSRPKSKQREESPGPGAYNVDQAPLRERRPPMWHIGSRTKYRSMDKTPGPNRYSLPTTLGSKVPDMKGAPGATIYGRSDYMNFSHDYAKTPGPAGYAAQDPSTHHRRMPMYSITGKNYMPSPRNTVPGPGTYNYYQKNSPKFAMGVRHSEFIVQPISMADVSE